MRHLSLSNKVQFQLSKTGSLVKERKDGPSNLQLLPLSGDALHLEWCGRCLLRGQGTPRKGGHGDWKPGGPEREQAPGGSADRLAVEISTESLGIACCHIFSVVTKTQIHLCSFKTFLPSKQLR